MTQRKTLQHVAIAGLAFAVLLFGGEGAAFGQLGNLLDKAKQASDAARKAVDAAKDATGTAVAPTAPTRTEAAPAPSAIQSDTDSSCLNPIEETLGIFQRYKNNCGVDIGVLTKNADGRTCSTGGIKKGQLEAIPPGSAVCRGFPERGPGCECPSGTGMENPSNRRFGVTTGARPGVVSGMRQDKPAAARAAPPAPAARPIGRYDEDGPRVKQCVAAARAKNLPEDAGEFRRDGGDCLVPCSADHEQFVVSTGSYARKEFLGQCRRSPQAHK